MKKISLIVLTLLLAGCGIFEPVPESYKNRLAETPEPVIAKDPVITEEPEDVSNVTEPIAEPVGPVTEIVTTDMVKYVNIVTGETATGPSIGGYLDNHPDWEQVHLDEVL
jgi:hypothetical protein